MRQKVQPSGGGPIAHAGSDQIASTLGLVTLDGSSSSGYSTIAWTLSRLNSDGTTTDSTDLLSNATVAGPTFTPVVAGVTYVATITLDADSDAVDSVAIKIPPALTLDLTGATESNTGQEGGNTSLGTTNRIEVAAVHGRPDSGVDAYAATKQLTDKPAGAVGIRVSMTCSTPDAAAAIGGNAGLYLLVSNTAALTASRGYFAGWYWTNTGTMYKAGKAARVGAAATQGGNLDAQADVGTLHASMVVWLDDADTPEVAAARAWALAGTTNGADPSSATSALTAGSEVHVGFVCDQQGATPGDVLDMQDVVFTYEWLT